MIISHRHKFVYVKTRKTASTSLEIALCRFCGPEDVITKIVPQDQALRERLGYPGPQNEIVCEPGGHSFELVNHSSALTAKRLLGERWDDYFKFTLERNPFDRIISQYWWDVSSLPERPPLAGYLRSLRPAKLSNWGLYTDHEGIIVDYVGRYESLEESLAFIARRIGLGEALLLPEEKTKSNARLDRRHWREVLSAADRELVEKACQRELEAFAYAW